MTMYSSSAIPKMLALFFTFWSSLVLVQVHGYTSGIPPLNRRALAGLWKLTPSILSMKEFTVHPRKPPKEPAQELLLMLKEDGSFTRYESDIDSDDDDDDKDATSSSKKKDLDETWKQFRKIPNGNVDPTMTLFKGTWDVRDGRLILAADRDEQKARSDALPADPDTATPSTTKKQFSFWKNAKDTVLVGVVVATSHQEPPQSSSNNNNNKLMVPMGSVQVGKFFYPKKHPSFFDQPIFQPKRFGTFQLRQVLGHYNLQQEQDDDKKRLLVEKFRNQDFHNKQFFLTSSSIEPKRRRPKGNVRWSIKYNKYVEDPPLSKKGSSSSSSNDDDDDDKTNRLIGSLRVLKVMVHANNTFSTVAGLGDSTILRGRFNVIGDQRDHVWMQSVRFGFGRSVSGSTYSEGNALGEEIKSYWGKISYQGDDESDDNEEKQQERTMSSSTEDDKPKKLQVKGTVLVGSGLEPQPIASFIMREVDKEEFFDNEDEDEEEEDDDDDAKEPPGSKDSGKYDDDDVWTRSDAFQ